MPVCEVCHKKFNPTSEKYFINDKEVCSTCNEKINLTKTSKEKTVKKVVKTKEKELIINFPEGSLFLVEILRKKYGANQSTNDGIQIYDSVELVKDAIAQVFKGKKDKKKKTKKDIDKIWQEICKHNVELAGKGGFYTEVYNEDADYTYEHMNGCPYYKKNDEGPTCNHCEVQTISEFYQIDIFVTIKQLNPSKIQIEEREFVEGDF